ncbi:MAG: SMI1/KNR4 family protein [Saprospiraceae bacterium]|nr:SMI1/KNR4 family protein [Saprospiraceae bacterium]
MQLINSFPSLDQSMIKELEQILFEKFDYSNLPKDYIDFLLRQNGGFVKAGSKHEEDRQVVVFNSPLKEGKGYWTPSLYAFYAAWLPNLMSKSMVKDRSLPGLIASNEHLKHE